MYLKDLFKIQENHVREIVTVEVNALITNVCKLVKMKVNAKMEGSQMEINV